VSVADQFFPHPGHTIPTITQSPPLRGKLVLARACSRELSDGLAAFPGGLNFRSLELSWCERPQALLAACGRTVTSISYLFRSGDNSESTSSIPVDIASNHWARSDPVGPEAKRGAREIRIQHHDEQSLASPRMDLFDTPINNFARLQRIRDLGSGLGVSG